MPPKQIRPAKKGVIKKAQMKRKDSFEQKNVQD